MNGRIIIMLLLGGLAVIVGLGVFTFTYAEGFSYFSSDPQACASCHIMNDQYDAWRKSSHHSAAKCVDCHMPQNSIIAKLVAKADNGYRHSKGFTFQDFHEPIMINERNSEILQANCIRCHDGLVHGIALPRPKTQELRCVQCHSHVGHGSTRMTPGLNGRTNKVQHD
jgi:cytochrome c nitrite reductase small subunit